MSEFVSPADAEDSLQATDVVRFQLSQLVTVESPVSELYSRVERHTALYTLTLVVKFEILLLKTLLRKEPKAAAALSIR